MSGGATFTVMTFNVESWLSLIKPVYKMAKDEKDEKVDYDEKNTETIREQFKTYLSSAPSASAQEKWTNLKAIFNGVNILCIQEDALMGEGRDQNIEEYKIDNEEQPNFIETIRPTTGNPLNLVSSCKSHPYRWNDTQGLYYSGSKLSNTIYSTYNTTKTSFGPQLKNELPNTIDYTINTGNKNHPRCWAISEIPILEDSTTKTGLVFSSTPKPVGNVKVASIHLSGGRFDDIASLTGNNFIIKIRQVFELLKQKPDIICGDLNTKLVPPTNDTYFLGLPYDGKPVSEYLKTNPITKSVDMTAIYTSIYSHISKNTPLMEDVSLLDKWHIWMYGLDYVFKDAKFAEITGSVTYKSVFADNNVAPNTTIFGGTVDMIYYNPIKLKCDEVSAVSGVIEPGIKILSDHAPIKAVFTFLTL